MLRDDQPNQKFFTSLSGNFKEVTLIRIVSRLSGSATIAAAIPNPRAQ